MFTVPPPGGRVRLSVTKVNLAPFGGLVPWAAFTKQIGIIDSLVAECPGEWTSQNATPVFYVLESLILSKRPAGDLIVIEAGVG